MSNPKPRLGFEIKVDGKSVKIEFPLQWNTDPHCHKKNIKRPCKIIQANKCPNRELSHTCKHPVEKYLVEEWNLLFPLVGTQFTGKKHIKNDFSSVNKRTMVVDAYHEIGERVVEAPMCIFKQVSHDSIGFVGQPPYPGVLVFTELPGQDDKIERFKSIFRPEAKGACSSDFLAKAYIKIKYAKDPGSIQWILPPPSSNPIAVYLYKFFSNKSTNQMDEKDTAKLLASIDLFLFQLRQVEECIQLVQVASQAKQSEYLYWFIGFIGLYYSFSSTNLLENYFLNDELFRQFLRFLSKFSDGAYLVFAARQLRQKIQLVNSLTERGLLGNFRARKRKGLLEKLNNINEDLREDILQEQGLLFEETSYLADSDDLDYLDYRVWRWAFLILINKVVTIILRPEGLDIAYDKSLTNNLPLVQEWEKTFSLLWNIEMLCGIRL